MEIRGLARFSCPAIFDREDVPAADTGASRPVGGLLRNVVTLDGHGMRFRGAGLYIRRPCVRIRYPYDIA